MINQPTVELFTVTMNPSLDTTIWTDGMDFAETNHTHKEQVDASGKGINVSRVLTRSGVANTALGLAGRENCSVLYRMLQEESVPFSFVECDGKIRENLSLVFPDGKLLKVDRKCMMDVTGKLSQLKELLLCRMGDPQKSFVVFAGSLSERLNPADFYTFVEEIRQTGCRIALDTKVFTGRQLCLLRPFVIKPNLYELQIILGKDLTNIEEIVFHVRELVKGGIDNVLVSMGGDGLLAGCREGIFLATVPKVTVRSAIGAGDSALSGFLCALSKGLSFEESVRTAAGFGTAAVTLDGTAVPHWDFAMPYISRVTVEQIG